jgi:hypothetical protein
MATEPNFNSMDEKLAALGRKIRANKEKRSREIVEKHVKEKPVKTRKKNSGVEEFDLHPGDEKMREFFECIEDGGVIVAACRRMKFKASRIYRRMEYDLAFQALVRASVRIGKRSFEDRGRDHAYNGLEVPKNMGKAGVVYVTEYDHRLLEFYLKADKPNKYRDTKVKIDNRRVIVTPLPELLEGLKDHVVDAEVTGNGSS